MSVEKLKELSDDVQAKLKELQAYAREEGGKAIGGAFAALLKRHPEVGHVSWTQYTPYFNDGEECVFGVNELCVVPAKKPEGEEDYSDYDYELGYGAKDFLGKEALKEFKELWNKVNDEEILRSTFGDHVQVRVTADGCEVEEYEHD